MSSLKSVEDSESLKEFKTLSILKCFTCNADFFQARYHRPKALNCNHYMCLSCCQVNIIYIVFIVLILKNVSSSSQD